MVGGGPAGLSAAYQLRRRGYGVTIFEASDGLGGLMRWVYLVTGWPEISWMGRSREFWTSGVTAELNAVVAGPHELKKLNEEYDAVYIATGATKSKFLPSLDYDSDWVIDSADFLAESARNTPIPCGDRMVVIGGGSAAMDVARSARRYGKDVTVLSLEEQAKMPAQRVEVDESLEEDIRFVDSSMLKSVTREDQELTLNCIKVSFTPGEIVGSFRWRKWLTASSHSMPMSSYRQ